MALIPHEQIVHTLERYGIGAARVELLSDVDCAVFRVHTSEPASGAHGGSPVLKVYPAHKRDVDAIQAEVEWLQALNNDTTLRVPRPIAATDGSVIQHVDPDAPDSRLCALFTWIEGRTRDADLTCPGLERIGRFVAGLHEHGQRWTGEAKRRLRRRTYTQRALIWILEMERPLTLSVEEWDVLTAAASRLHQEITAIGEGPDVFGFIHGDLHLTNFLFHEETVGVIDFSDCAWGHYADDIASVLVFLKHPFIGNVDHSADFDRYRDAFVEGYQAIRALPRDLGPALSIYFAARILLVLAYVHEARDTVEWVPDCLTRSRQYLEQYLRGDLGAGLVL